MAALPAWYPDPEEAKPAPMPLLLVQAFVNTRDPDTHVDAIGDPDRAKSWFASAGLLPADSQVRPDELTLAHALRESVRSLLPLDPDETPTPAWLDPIRELTQTRRPRLAVDERGTLSVENSAHDDLADALFDLLLLIRGAQEDGTWSRLKICGNPECRWVFYDRSRNQQGHWCNMDVCGNRLKNRRLRARRR
jgi:predicted RNA-binding Zn ribbon-like protein